MRKTIRKVPSLEVTAFLFPKRPFRRPGEISVWFRAWHENGRLKVEAFDFCKNYDWFEVLDLSYIRYLEQESLLMWVDPIEVEDETDSGNLAT